jgi:DMSO/TMAO reductase YedYZ molybdopterin-dependent catalytic subunit
MSNSTFSRNAEHPMAATAVTRQQSPANVEFAFGALESFTTPNSSFYVRSHFQVPAIDLAAYRLTIEGDVENRCELSFEELRSIAPATRHATLECAGNGRVFLVPQVNGAQWEQGAVSTARWTGVPLADVLARAGVKSSAVEIIFEGADHGHAKEPPVPPGEIHYAHSIPLAKVTEVLLAYEMNDLPLPPSHGFPLRVVVPGWYGMASVKWVTRIIVSSEKFRGYFRTVDYAYWTEQAGHPVHVPIEEMSVKSQIARPAKNEVVSRDSDYLITGAAWTGESEIAKVEVSTDGGQTYVPAKLLGEAVLHAWRLWELSWRTPSEPGFRSIIAKATDARGRTQPIERNPNHGTYIINHLVPTEIAIA